MRNDSSRAAQPDNSQHNTLDSWQLTGFLLRITDVMLRIEYYLSRQTFDLMRNSGVLMRIDSVLMRIAGGTGCTEVFC
jgi:hypothetical protein